MGRIEHQAGLIRAAAGGAKEHAGRPLTVLRSVGTIRGAVDRLEVEAVDDARAAGATWQQIADQLGVTRQVAHRKHASRLARPNGEP